MRVTKVTYYFKVTSSLSVKTRKGSGYDDEQYGPNSVIIIYYSNNFIYRKIYSME